MRGIQRDAVVVAALAAFLFFAAANLQAGWMYAIDALLVGMLAAAWLSAAWSVRGLHVQRSLRADVHEGDDVAVVLELRTRRFPRFFLEVTDQVPGLTAHRAVVPVVWPGEPLRLRYVATALRRGIFAGGTVSVQSSGLAGWFRVGVEIAAPSALTVLPRVWRVRRLGLPGHRDSNALVVPRPARAGLDVSGVRDYREGDSLHHVHWRSTARRGQLVIREYEHDPHDAAVLLLDARSRGEGAAARREAFEDLVRAAASVADALARGGHPVRITGSVNGTPVEAGPSRGTVMRWLAGVRNDASVDPGRIYDTLCAVGTPVLVFTADPGSAAHFAARGIPHATILADLPSYRGEEPTDRLIAVTPATVVIRRGDDIGARLEGML